MTRVIIEPRRIFAVNVLLLLMSMPLASAAADMRDDSALDVSITVFDPGVPADLSSHRDLQVFPRIREIEAMFLPFVLRDTLARTNEWGAVRVVPEPDVAAELLVSGTIIRSDGETLEIRIVAVDASGRTWIDKSFTGAVTDNYRKADDQSDKAGYQELYDEIARDIQASRDRLDKKALNDVVEISLLRYGNQLAPSAFGEYLSSEIDGRFSILRLPARNDPMLVRIERLRSYEYVITDAVDAKYEELSTDIASVYDFWRRYRRKVVEYQVEDERRAQDTESSAPRGSYEALKKQYDNYKWGRITAQEQDRLAVAFDNEVGPKVEAMETRVAELQGWVDYKYTEWHRLLEQLFEVETSLAQ